MYPKQAVCVFIARLDLQNLKVYPLVNRPHSRLENTLAIGKTSPFAIAGMYLLLLFCGKGGWVQKVQISSNISWKSGSLQWKQGESSFG